MTTVVNIRKDRYDVYCGRPSIYGNPFEIGKDGNREQVIEKYREYFSNKIKEREFKKSILSLKDKRIGCFCAHSLVILML